VTDRHRDRGTHDDSICYASTALCGKKRPFDALFSVRTDGKTLRQMLFFSKPNTSPDSALTITITLKLTEGIIQ